VATPQAADQLAIGTYNVENLAPKDPADKYARLGDGVVTNLRSPDVISVEAIQDKPDPSMTASSRQARPSAGSSPPSRLPAARHTPLPPPTRSTTRTATSRAATSGRCSSTTPSG